MTAEKGQPRTAGQTPTARTTVEEYLADFPTKLKAAFGLEPFGPFSIIVEGRTDIDYLLIAAEKVQDSIGVDLLDATASGRGDARITVCTPVEAQHSNPEMRGRGGSKQLGRLINFMKGYTSIIEGRSRLCFVVDHDEAGLGTLKALKDAGFAVEYMGVSLDPCHHPTACSKSDVVIEDLLSLRVQKACFDKGGCSCRHSYVDGTLCRIEWNGQSKAQLPNFVREHGDLADVMEIVHALLRVREIWGLPVPALTVGASSSP